LFNIKPK
jgi:hypothetical protein